MEFARLLAVLGLTAAITAGSAGMVSAAPADRGGDEVVLKGSALSGLQGTDPDRVVAFRWSGKWTQIPVQVDERHVVDVRKLYPPGNHPPYVGNDDPDFDLEVYADAKTRSGSDLDASFDADDELVFMGGDAGTVAPAKVGPPPGVYGKSGVKVKVDDPVGGGNAVAYLFKATMNLEPGAGLDYVDYNFQLPGLTGGKTLLNDYGYFSSFNTEDSTVTTDNYRLHSFDRWMEDEMVVRAGGASQVDILDREVAQATKFVCARSEYTFSGRWQQDTAPGNDTADDDEGTYIAVIDGPVRAMRSYMGANSGPYTQREHIYYADHEKNTIFLRVHPMTDLYSWTDYAPSAIGMTYRDANNPAGVPVDGNPDTLVPTTTEEVSGGAYTWQQLAGPQGTVSTVVGARTNIPEPNFGNYYLDDSTPTAADQIQCGGDLQSIGASGFGILGPSIPNTDPRQTVFNDLTVDRVRYFSPPGGGSEEASAYRSRVEKPLLAAATANPVSGKPGTVLTTKLKLGFPGKKTAAKPGRVYRLKVKVRNSGTLAAKKVKLCVQNRNLRSRNTCRSFGPVGSARAKAVTMKLRVKPNAKGRKLALKVTATSKFGKSKAKGSLGVPLKR